MTMKSENFKFGAKHQLPFLVLLAVGLNLNTLFHEYALDDIVVLTENRFVQKGLRGIPEILSQDYIYGYMPKENVLTGARYRPLSLVLFALEYQFFGANPIVSHLFNILLFGLLIALLYKLLHDHVFKKENAYLAFITCALFAAHPIHTEVIANVKSRDELITFILLILSLITLIKYKDRKTPLLLFTALLTFFLALLTKESAVTFIGVLPLIYYFFFRQPVKNAIRISIPYIGVFLGYMLIRFFIVGLNSYPVDDVTNSPYIYATGAEAFATKIFVLIKYMALLLFPHPLSTEYGYNQIPYISMYSKEFSFSSLILLGLIGYALYTFNKRSLFSFCILYFLVTISVGTNLIFDLGTTLAERMLFQPSLAFCIAAALLYLKLNQHSKLISNVLLFSILTLFSIKTIARNADWKNNETLFLKDVVSSPNSARINLFAAETYIIKANKESNENLKNEFLQRAIYYGEKSLKIHDRFAYTYLRLGFAYYHLHNYLKAADLWIKAAELEPTNPEVIKWTETLSTLLYKEGNGYVDQDKTEEAINCYLKSTSLNNTNLPAWYELGKSYFSNGDTTKAIAAWDHVKKLDPDFHLDSTNFTYK